MDEITGASELDAIIHQEDRGIVLDMWGTWCQPCRTLRPHVEDLAEQYDDKWRVLAVHVESSPELVDRFDIQSTPTFIYLHEGVEVHRSTGAVTPTTIAGDMAVSYT